jgi:hypothetical protein
MQRAVEIGLQDQLYAEVKSGLKAGDVVSTDLASSDGLLVNSSNSQ